jgi:hypothetical protein
MSLTSAALNNPVARHDDIPDVVAELMPDDPVVHDDVPVSIKGPGAVQCAPVGDSVQGAVDEGAVQGTHQEAVFPRPRRAAKPNPKYSPDVYVKVRERSRRSIRRVSK